MSPDEFVENRETHFRPIGESPVPWLTARIVERKANDVGEVPVQYDDGHYGAIRLDGVDVDVELFSPLREAPTRVWFVAAKYNDHPFYDMSAVSRSLPPGLRFGPYSDEQRDKMLAEDAEWDKHVWHCYERLETVVGVGAPKVTS